MACFIGRPGPCQFPPPPPRPPSAELLWLWKETRHSVNYAGMAGIPVARIMESVAALADRCGFPWDAESIEHFNVLQDFVVTQEIKRADRKAK